MDTATLIAEIIKAVAWPLVAFIIFLFLRKPLLDLLGIIESFKWKNWQVDFKREIEEAAHMPGLEKLKVTAEIRDKVAMEPRAVILEEWLGFRDQALAALESKNVAIDSETRNSPTGLAQALMDSGLLAGQKAAGAISLAKVRNMAAHSRNLSLNNDTTLEYIKIARGLASDLARVVSKPRRK